MKKYVLLTLCLAVFATTWALPVTKEQARSQARQYLLQRRLPGNGQIELSDVAKSTILKSKSSDAAPQLYYVFNVNGSDGFIIVSADDSTQPILGWCDHGSFDAANMPANMRALLESYEEELQRHHGENRQHGAHLLYQHCWQCLRVHIGQRPPLPLLLHRP